MNEQLPNDSHATCNHDAGKRLVRKWLDDVDARLMAEAKEAGILGNPSMTGDARERIVRNALSRVLPATIEVGKGKVIGAGSPQSRQVDIVIFDGRFPVLRVESDALYPVEGVIATVDVKSFLTGKEIGRGSENAVSVMRIQPSYVAQDAELWLAKREVNGMAREAAIHDLHWSLMPRTYIFGFGGLNWRTHQGALSSCLRKSRYSLGGRTVIPSVIVGGNVASLAIADGFSVESPEMPAEDQARLAEDCFAITFETERRFGILASHLLWHLEQRTLLLEHSRSVRRVVQPYLPFLEYVNDCIRNKPYIATLSH